MINSIIYYITPSGENPVNEFLDSLTEKQQVKILRIFQYIKDYGLIAVQNHVKKISGTPLWEIRILGKDNLRILYFISGKAAVLVIHGFVKKSQKIKLKEINI